MCLIMLFFFKINYFQLWFLSLAKKKLAGLLLQKHGIASTLYKLDE